MGKENALGYDPLSRTRSPNENRKSPLLDPPVMAKPQGDRNAQQTNAPGPFKRSETPADVTKPPQTPGRMTGNADPAASTPKPKVVIGRLYEKPTPEREKPAPRAEEVRQEARPAPEVKAPQSPIPTAPDRMAGAVETPAAKPRLSVGRLYEKPAQLGEVAPQEVRYSTDPVFPETSYAPRSISPMMGRPATEIPRNDHTVSPGKFSNYIIIVYTAIMLILGYIVYRDVSKRVSRVESRILAIEKKLNP
ncbi:MAG: hypothetical protein AAB069_01275 [Planctomycetota bacterium]